MQNPANIKRAIVVFLFILLALVSAHTGGFWFDIKCFNDWSLHIFKNGLDHAYGTWNNYMPVYQYVMWMYGKIAGSEKEIGHFIHHLKMFTILFDFLGLWFVYKWIDKKTDFFLLLLFNMLNIAFVYNTVVWGQVDSIFTAMVFASLYYAYDRKMVLSALWFVFAINMKLQAIVFLPILGLIYLYIIAERKSIKQVLAAIMAIAVCQALLLWPFMTVDGGWELFWKVVTSADNTYPRIAGGAYNFWYFIVKGNPSDIEDSTILMAGLTYKRAGLLLFFASSFIAMWPLLKNVFRKLAGRAGSEIISKERLWLICALVPVLFMYFCTQMHERYCHPAFIFIVAYSFYTGRVVPYILFSVAYFINLEVQMRWLWLEDAYNTALVFKPQFTASVYGILILYLFVRLYGKDSPGRSGVTADNKV